MRVLPNLAQKWLFLFVIIATVSGTVFDNIWGNTFDYWLHDSALVYQAREKWKHAAIVVLDDHVPVQVGRKQALPLYARATEKLIAAGAKAVFLDARVPKLIEGVMPYALCIEANGGVRWSQPTCSDIGNSCQLGSSLAGNAPLKMKAEVFPYFRIAPYLVEQTNLPDFLLYDWEAEPFIPASGLVALDRLVTKDSSIDRWMDLTEDHAAVILAGFVQPEPIKQSLAQQEREVCDSGIPCRRIRFSRPHYKIQFSDSKPIIPVSKLAACDDEMATKTAAYLKNRVVILQLTAPAESTDVVVTPMTTALFGPHLLTPGSQYLADAVETLLNNDHPREPHLVVKLFVFLLSAILSVFTGAYLRQFCLWCTGLGLFSILVAACLFTPLYQLWPVTAAMMSFLTGALQMISVHLVIGFREGELVLKYMPKQVHDMLLLLKQNETFQNQRYEAIVLMSDMTGYTTITEMIREPSSILELMNDYLEATSFVLQNKYQGWLETYIGDMVCYYWPYKEKNKTESYRNALLGALELSALQKRFFADVSERYKHKFDDVVLKDMSMIMNAGIGLSSGTVVMGDLGPKQGVRKFGILGDPMNLTARVESLTRHFNCEIIVTSNFIDAGIQLKIPFRRLGCFCVKGRDVPEMLYAVGDDRDPRFNKEKIVLWEQWLGCFEAEIDSISVCPDFYIKDQSTLLAWKNRGLLIDGIWHLDEK